MKKQKSKNKILSTKHNNGITLIALIITIVVLLILAVVSIGTIRNSRIITHSQNASNDYTIAQEKEQIQLALGEWQIQKNIPNNNQTFKDVMTSELANVADVSGENTLTITMKKTQNRYTVTDDGATTSLGKVTELEKYVFGEDLNGRSIDFIQDKLKVYDSSSEIEDDDIIILSDIYNSDERGRGNYKYFMYILYEGDVYRFVYIACGDGLHVTVGDYGLTKVDVPENETKVGKKVSYAGEMWTIIYDNETVGLQMVSDNTILYNSGKFTLNGVNSYNNAITELNTACESLFKENRSYKNSNIVDVRCVGSNPENKIDENAETFSLYYKYETFDSELDTEVLESIKYDIKGGNDTNFISDYDRMLKLGICVAKNTEEVQREYWFASRYLITDFDVNKTIGLRYVQKNGKVDRYGIMKSGEGWAPCSISSYLRPVIKLKSDVVFSGEGTESNPYTF